MILSIILPVHNEQHIIEATFSEIYKKVKGIEADSEFILVENGSRDETLKVVNKLAKKFADTKVCIAPKGYGSAIIKGLTMSRGNYICYMPSDGQVDINVFGSLWSLAKEGKWEIVKVKRRGRENLTRTIVSRAFSLIIAILFQLKIIDINGSPRIIKKSDLARLDLKSTDSFIDCELLIKSKRLEWKIKEIPMLNLERMGGQSTRGINTFLEFFSNIYKYRFGDVLDSWNTKVSNAD